MENKKYLGIDIGTTSVKAAVFDRYGKRLGIRRVDYTLSGDSKTGYIEFDAEKYVEMCKGVIEELTRECGKIEALSIDTQGETLILTDEGGTPLTPAVVWLDNRATAEAEEIARVFGRKRVYEVTGQPEITAGWPASKLLWFKNNRPEIFSRAKKIFMLEDYVLYRLTGNFVSEPTIQSSTLYYDVTKGVWWEEMLGFLGVDKAQLPSIKKTGEVVGEYLGIKVIAGMLDQIAGTLGAGASCPSVISEMTGTIMAICVMTDKMPPFNEESIIPCHVHALDGKYCLILWSSTAGMALKWFRENFAKEYSFRLLDEIASEVAPGCNGMCALPYFCGSTMPKYNPDATASFTGVTLSHTRAHFARAIMESIAFLLKQNLEYVGDSGVKEIRITGGGASSPLWSQIKSDVTGKVLKTVSEEETACLGTALVAAYGAGEFSSIEEAVKSAVTEKKIYTPSGADYKAAYERYCAIDKIMN